MKKTTWFAALCAAMMTLLATGCDNGMTDAAVAAVAAGQRPGTGSSHIPSMPDGEIDDNGVLTKYTGSETAVVIPDGVTSIGGWAFMGCESLASVMIPASVTSINGSAFCECTSLTDVTYTGTLAQWCALSNDYYLMSYAKHVTVAGTDLKQATTLVIPDGVTSIGSGAFERCTSLTSVEIPASVTSIGYDAFYKCESLASVEIGNGVTSIGYYAFYGCTSLASVMIGNGVESIGSGAFSECTSLTEIQFNGTKAQWQAIEGSSGVNVTCVFCTDGHIGVETVPDYLTMRGTAVTGYTDALPADLAIPDGVTSISYDAFDGCKILTSVTIPASVKSIHGIQAWNYYGAFEYCSNLASVTIGNGVENIGMASFQHCTSLTSMTIPGSVTSIGIYAFRGCTSLATVKYEGTVQQWNEKIEKGSNIFQNTSVTEITCTNGTVAVDENGNTTE